MRLATVQLDEREIIALVDQAGTVFELTSLVGPRSMIDLIADWDALSPTLATARDLPAIASPHYLAPIPHPRRNLFAVGKNYRDLVSEFGRSGYDSPDRSEEVPDRPVVFSKATTTVTGPYDDIDAHTSVTSELDYEAELAVIIGRGGRSITEADAMTHVLATRSSTT
jgi:2-keto-4-pentenoate hydratase/2-oxohepta-3-ene-1,7-dioic acid hydratase in catechol pathway